MRKLSLVFLTGIFIVLLLAGCGGSVKTYTDAGQKISVGVGQEFVLALGANPTTGYSWQVHHNESVLTLVEQKYEPGNQAQQGLVGAGGVEFFRFKALQKGETSITLSYQRPWEGQAIEQKVFAIDIK